MATLQHAIQAVRAHLNFYRIHIIGLFVVPCITAAIFYASNGATHFTYVDALFMNVSAITGTGLQTVLLSDMTTWQQVMLFLQFIFGSPVAFSYYRLAARRYAFGKDALLSELTAKENAVAAEHDQSRSKGRNAPARSESSPQSQKANSQRGSWPNPVFVALRWAGISLRQRLHGRKKERTSKDTEDAETHDPAYFSFRAKVGSNSHIYTSGLSQAERKELGQLERDSMTILLWMIGGLCLVLPLAVFIMIAPYFSSGTKYDAAFQGSNRSWFSFFIVGSLFSNCGLTIVDTSLTEFQDAFLLLIPGIFLMLAGNIAFPIVLRWLIWMSAKLTTRNSRRWRTLHFLLDHPRRCYYLLFPRYETYIFAMVVFSLIAFDYSFLFVLDVGNPVLYDLPPGVAIVDGLVQSVAIRNAGFYTLLESALSPAAHMLQLFMIWFSIYPLAMVIRASNPYEERAMGLQGDADAMTWTAEWERLTQQRTNVDRYLRDQLAYDLWYVALIVWLICIIEKTNLEDSNSDAWFNVFSIIYETVSAYANCGVTLGIPNQNISLCGDFRILSKLLLITAMVRGRTRSLPFDIDMATMMPHELIDHVNAQKKCEDED